MIPDLTAPMRGVTLIQISLLLSEETYEFESAKLTQDTSDRQVQVIPDLTAPKRGVTQISQATICTSVHSQITYLRRVATDIHIRVKGNTN